MVLESKKRCFQCIDAPEHRNADATVTSNQPEKKLRLSEAMDPESGTNLSSSATWHPGKQGKILLAQEERQNIYALPDEILSTIFEMIYSPDPGGFTLAKRLSHISRRFRTVAFNTPRLWSTVSNKQSPTELQAFLDRSGAGPLKILVLMRDEFEYSVTPDIERFADALFPAYACQRWESTEKYLEYREDAAPNYPPLSDTVPNSLRKLGHHLLIGTPFVQICFTAPIIADNIILR